jgi:glycosyltransferase involved in cell wall biosynthesis
MATDLKILLVGDFPPPSGGVATHVEELFHAVRAEGGECDVLDVGKGQLPASGVVPAGGMARFAALLAWYSARAFRIHLHTSGANPKSWLLASACAAAGRLGRRPATITLHSGLGPGWLLQSPARGMMARAILRQFGKVIAVSGEIRDALGVSGVEVAPAFSSRLPRPGPPPAGLTELRAAAAPLYCAMIAPQREYGAAILLRAFERVRGQRPAARLALYGRGSEQVQAEGVRGFGEVTRPQALAVTAACDVFVRPTLADGDSVSVREALALGRAVVATRVGHRPAGVRLVEPGDAEALADGMLEAIGEEAPCAASAAS